MRSLVVQDSAHLTAVMQVLTGLVWLACKGVTPCIWCVIQPSLRHFQA
jgi:hypothetical protein